MKQLLNSAKLLSMTLSFRYEFNFTITTFTSPTRLQLFFYEFNFFGMTLTLVPGLRLFLVRLQHFWHVFNFFRMNSTFLAQLQLFWYDFNFFGTTLTFLMPCIPSSGLKNPGVFGKISAGRRRIHPLLKLSLLTG